MNAIQDRMADLSNFTQTIDLAGIRIGEAGLQLIRYGGGEARLTGAFRADGIVRGLGGFVAGAFTNAQRDAIGAGLAPKGIMIYNTDRDEVQINTGSDTTRIWKRVEANPVDATVSDRFVGELAPYAPPVTITGIQEPVPGWLVCNGAAVSRTLYAALYAKLQSNYGSGDGSTTFNLPNFLEKQPLPRGGSQFTTVGAVGGATTHTLATGELPQHTHPISNSGDHAHPPFPTGGMQFAMTVPPTAGITAQAGNNLTGITGHFGATGNAGNHNHGGATGQSGGGSPHNNMSPYQIIGAILIRY
jgi:microcystin-dependent protein